MTNVLDTPEKHQQAKAEAQAKRQARKKQQSEGNPSPARQNKFVFHSLDEIESVPLPQWLVKPIIIDGGVGQFYGESGTGKSFICIDLGMHVAHGWDWYGHKTKKRPVRYLVLEGAQGFMLRLRAYKQWASVAGNTQSQIINGDFQYYTGDLSLMDKKQIDDFIEVIPKGALVFIDTQAQATAGVQENTSELGTAINNAQRISREAHCTVILVHHAGKDVSKGGRGWSGQIAAWDFEIELKGKGQEIRTWKVTKCKDGPEGETRGYSLPIIQIVDKNNKPLLDEDGDPVRTCVARHEADIPRHKPEGKQLTANQQYALESLKSAIEANNGEPVHLEVWRPVFYSKSTGDTQGAKQKAFHRGRTDLKNLGLILPDNDYYSIISKPDARQDPDITQTRLETSYPDRQDTHL